ncbi:MAG: hypothetical protein ACJ749_13065 [Flavisolibacter sp.]
MVLLQAAMSGGFVLIIVFGVFFIIGTPVLTRQFIRTYWKLKGKSQHFINTEPFYKDPFPFLISILLSISVLIGFCYLMIILFDALLPNFGYFN